MSRSGNASVLGTLLLLAGQSVAGSGLDFGAGLRLGADHYDAFFSRQSENDTVGYLRQLALSADYAPHKDWALELEMQWERLHGNDEFEFGDANLRYLGGQGYELSAGRMKEPFGMERLLSSANLAVSERSQVTRALAPGRSIGLQIAGYRAHMSWQFGLFREESQSSDATDAVTTRLSWAPVQTEHDVLHLGAALSQRWHRGDPFQIREEAELFSADSVLRSPRIDAVDRTLGGLELAWLHRSFSMSAEAMAQQVSDHDGVNWRFGGQYVQLGCLLTGEQRAYRKGLLKGVVPRHAFGAWELVVRHSHLDARDHARGSVSKLTLLGLNAHFPNHFKLTLSLLEAKITGELRSPQDRGKALSLSVQARL